MPPASEIILQSQVEELSVGSYKVFYLYTLPYETHANRIKVGDATLHSNLSIKELIGECAPNDLSLYTSPRIEAAAKRRIDEQTKTADIAFELLGAYLAVRQVGDRWEAFRDYAIHDVLMRSGFKKSFARADKSSGEWFETEVATVLDAARAVITGKSSITDSGTNRQIVLRPEQLEAIKKTKRVLKNGTVEEPKSFLWNAIMRFGKTVTAFKLVEDLQKDIKKVLVLTHRPVVVEGWAEDFNLIFDDESGWKFASKHRGETWQNIKHEEKFFYFASVQDLRGSFDEANARNEDDAQTEEWTEEQLAEVFSKNREIFETSFDIIVLDEAHEGLKTELADRMFDELKTKYYLRLSGTPFNLIEDFDANHIYTWSYIDEQKAKATWTEDYPYDPNPYASLPELELRTYNINKIFANYPEVKQEGVYFDFNRFFAVDKTQSIVGEHYEEYHPFKNAGAVQQLLSLMTNTKKEFDPTTGVFNSEPSSFPYANSKGWIDFADTLWLLPNINATRAMHELILQHPAYSGVSIVNASGNNDSGDPLGDVQKAIRTSDKTITLSIGKLTTGTTVPEWTAVFMMSNMKSAMLYMQTIFRSKSSGSLRDGRPKEKAYVFDFAPDRTLQMVVEAGRANAHAKAKEDKLKISIVDEEGLERDYIDELLTYLPIISYDGAHFEKQDSRGIMDTINRVYIEQNIQSGFNSFRLFNKDALGQVTLDELGLFKDLALSVSKSTSDNDVKKVKISESVIAENLARAQEIEAERRALKAKERSLFPDLPFDSISPEEQELLDEEKALYKQIGENKRQMMLTLRGVSVRLPLMILGMRQSDRTDYSTRVTIDSFATFIDDESWKEFMPKNFHKTGLDQPSWESLGKYFNKAVFEGSVQALQDKVAAIHDPRQTPLAWKPLYLAQLFSTFVNPDRETILTPFRVVNLQYTSTLGGLRWVDMDDNVRVKNVATGEIELRSIDDTIRGLESETLELALEWVTSDVDPVEGDSKDFWEDWDTTIFDINSKTALYPLFAASSRFYAERVLRGKSYEGRRIANPYAGLSEDETLAKDLLLWKEIIENNIYVNCRVPYGKAIAERVLRGYDREVKVNTSVVDVIEVRNKLKELDFYNNRPEPKQRKNQLDEEYLVRLEEWTAEDPATHIDRVWQWVLNPEAMKAKVIKDDKIETLTDKRARIIMEAESSIELLKRLEETGPEENKFSCVVSNPPYQENLTENTSKAKAVWPDFIEVSSNITQYASFINPGRWQRGGSGTGLLPIKKYFLKSGHLVKFICLPDEFVFPGIGIGEITIEMLDFTKTYEFPLIGRLIAGEIVTSEYKPSDLIDIVLSDEIEEVVVKILKHKLGPNFEKELWIGGQDNKTKKETAAPIGDPRMDYGIVGPRMSRDREYFVLDEERKENVDYLKIYYSPSSNNVASLYLPLSELQDTERNLSRTPKWKVLIPKTNAHFIYRNFGPIAEPNSLCTNTWVCRSFDTEAECKGFQSYLKTYFYRFLISSRNMTHNATANVHRFVPDLLNITNPRTGLVGYDSDWTDEDLKILFKDVLTEEDWAYIKKTAIEADPAGMRMKK